jgi:hypothetical protein
MFKETGDESKSEDERQKESEGCQSLTWLQDITFLVGILQIMQTLDSFSKWKH